MQGHGTAPERRWRNQPLERERDHRRILWLWTMLAGMIVAALPAGTHLFHQNLCLEVSYRVGELAAEHDRLLEEERRLCVERARLESLEGIEAWARRQQGLVRPEPDRVLVVGPDRAEPAPPARQASSRSGTDGDGPTPARRASSYR